MPMLGFTKKWVWTLTALSLLLALVAASLPRSASAIGEPTRIEIRGVLAGDEEEPRPSARRRLAWEVRKRTSVATRLEPTRVRLDDPSIFESPFLYWSGSEAFEPLSVEEIVGLRRYVEFGGFVFIDNAEPLESGFDASVRRALRRAFPTMQLKPLAAAHTVYRAFYLVERPVGRVQGPAFVEGIDRKGRTAVIYSRHDLGGAWARDRLGTWQFSVAPGGETQREMAMRFGVNVVIYALCLDYKDDQVHAPYIMRRRGGLP